MTDRGYRSQPEANSFVSSVPDVRNGLHLYGV